MTTEALALALSWTTDRLDAALHHARTHPVVGGALVLRIVPPDGYTATPRLDVVRPDQADAVAGRRNFLPHIRGVIQPVGPGKSVGTGWQQTLGLVPGPRTGCGQRTSSSL
ncbi:hypothetical protein AB0K71_28950 [Streptomyces syringium]|uniref:hypothetical protein n=1 Tax=Streptomyces syringium TaxID=76729 RepID=UPI0034389DBD